MNFLSPRQQSILNRIVETHIETAQPVGSRCLTDLYTEIYRSSYSPATVRAEMGYLEEAGYLTHPHPSAGRIPTDQGYRYYVDHSLKEEKLSDDLFQKVHQEFSESSEELESVAEKTVRILSELTEEVGIMAVSDPDAVPSEKCRLFFQGSSRILAKPEFQSPEKVRGILEILDEKKDLARWLVNQDEESQVRVTIGRENRAQAFEHCTMISISCGIGGQKKIGIAVLGPRRMHYAKTLPLVDCVARAARRFFEN